MTNSQKINVVIIGYGLAGSSFHAPFISTIDGYNLAGVVTNNPQRRQAAEESHTHCEIFSSVEQIWNRSEKFDLAIVTSPNKLHFEHAQKAMQSGLSVVVDKPLTTTSASCQGLIDISKKSKVLLSVYQNRRWDSDFVTLQQLLRENELGQPIRFESRFQRWRPLLTAAKWQDECTAADGGGRLFDFGSHLIDQALQLFGPVRSVYAEVKTQRPGAKSDDDSFLSLEFDNGVQAHLWMSFLARHAGPRFTLTASNGYFECSGLDPQESWLRAGHKPIDGLWKHAPEPWGSAKLIVGAGEQAKVETIPQNQSSYGQFYIDLLDALRGTGPVPVLPEQAYATLRVIEAARHSSEHGAVIDMHDFEVEPANP